MPDPINAAVNPHKEAEELLPWYATGQLDAEEFALVDNHLGSCAHCRRQLAAERRMIDEFASLTPEIDSGWERLRQRIEPRLPARRRGWREKAAADVAALWQSLARPRVAAFAFAQLAFVVVAGSVLLSLSRPSYHALGSAPAPQSANVIAMFRGDTTETQLRRLLRANGATLAGGPTPTDAYLLHVPERSRTAVLAKLRSDDHVVLAQPIDGPGS
jgi:anti-sigma-K factor RskA